MGIYGYLMKMWEFLQSRKYKVVGGIGVVGMLTLMAFKTGVYDRTLTITEVRRMLFKGEFSKVVLGNFMMLCYFKSPA